MSGERRRSSLILELSGWAVSVAPLCKPQQEQSLGAWGWKQATQLQLAGRNRTGCKHSPNQPRSTAVLLRSPMFVRSHPTAKDAFRTLPKPFQGTELHSTSPVDKLCSGKCQWKGVHPLSYRCFSAWSWALWHGGQNSMSRVTLEMTCFLLLHEVAARSIENEL